mmetsp:Transcript_32939/g.32286  ORF Transcript_32939/g.32286 Transcript_32939/m.32286 type:complete len:130 (+) Transcript_32939:383-772(+)
MQGLLEKSSEFPFLLCSFLFPKYSFDIIDLMITKSDNSETREKLKTLKKIIELLKSIFQNFSELKFRKVILIPEIRYLTEKFIEEVREGKIEIRGMIKDDSESDKVYVWKVIQTLQERINTDIGEANIY